MSTVPITLATQMNINKLTANRIEPSSPSTSALRRRGEELDVTGCTCKKRGRPDSVPPYSSCRSGPFDRLRVVQVCLSSNLLHIVALKESTQAGCVVSHGCNVAIGHAIGDFEHFGTVVAVAAAEQTELFGNVV